MGILRRYWRRGEHVVLENRPLYTNTKGVHSQLRFKESGWAAPAGSAIAGQLATRGSLARVNPRPQQEISLISDRP